MSKINDNNSNDKETKSSKIIIISKGRLSSADNKANYMTLQEGDEKLTMKMKNEKLNNNEIIQAISNLRRQLKKNTTSYSNLEYESNNKNASSHKKNILKSPLFEKDSNKNKIKKIKLKSILSIETTKSLNLIKTSENDINNDDIYNKANEIKIKNVDIMTNKENNNLNNNYIYNNINDEEIVSIKIKDGSKNDNNNSSNFQNNSQKNFKQESNNSQNPKKETIDINKSEEKKLVRSHNIKENIKKNEKLKEGNHQPSEITTKSILGSISAQRGDNINSNINRLMTEQEIVEKNTVNSKRDLLSESKSVKIDENENEEEELEEVEDEYDEKIKEDNNLKMINNLNVAKTNFLHNIDNNESKNDNFQKSENKFNEASQNKNIINYGKMIKSVALNPIISNNNIYRMCSICEHTYLMSKIFVAECNDHYICRRCAKNYYQDKIEEGEKNLFCPFLQCKANINLRELKNIISSEHYIRLIDKTTENAYEETQNKLAYTKLKTNFNKEEIQLYTKKHVIDINSNKNFFNYNKIKDGYCPNCYEESLFAKTNTHYFKCLNCRIKICKYCFKEYIDRHIDIHSTDHCKVYYRLEEDENKKNYLFIFLMQLLFVIACFYFTFLGSFYFFRDSFFRIFNIKNKWNCFKYLFAYFLSIIFFIISIPFIFLLYPYFPSIIALFDY